MTLEEFWRLRVEEAANRHKLAQANCAKVLNEYRSGLTVPPDGSYGVTKAIMEESAALQHHIRILRIFTDLTLYGKIPADE